MNEMRSAKDRKNAKVAVQQYTTTAAHVDQLGEQARKLRQEMADTTDAVADTREELKGYNERRREQTAELKEILTPIVRHLQAGGTANGVTGLHNWAAWYNPTAKDGKNAARQIMRIVNSLEPGEEQGGIKSPIHLNFDKIKKAMDEGHKLFVTIGDHKYSAPKFALGEKGTVIHISVADIIKEAKKSAKKPVRLRHVPNPRFTGNSLCTNADGDPTSLRDSNRATKRYPATCEKCIELAAQLLPPKPKVKKISATDTQRALNAFKLRLMSRRAEEMTEDERTRPAWLLEALDAEIAQHPEWTVARVNKARREMKAHVQVLEEQSDPKVKIKLSSAQAREVRVVGTPDGAYLGSQMLLIRSSIFDETAKALVLSLEQRIESLTEQKHSWIEENHDLYYESDMGASQAARDVKNEVKKLEGAITACNGAIRTVAFGSLDDEYNILEWQEAREQEREEKERAAWEAESEKHAAKFDARREKAIVGWEQDSNSTWKNVDGRSIKKHRASFKIGAELDARYVVSDVEGVIGVVAVGDGAWDGLMKALETKREPMHPAAEALAAVVCSPDCPSETEEVV